MTPTEYPGERTELLKQDSLPLEALTGGFEGEPVDVVQMRKTMHNDPVASKQEMNKLFGSTRMLRNSVLQQSQGVITASFRRSSYRSAKSEGRRSFVGSVVDKQKESAVLFLEKVKHSFFEDARSLAEGTIPQSTVLAIVIGTVCGVACAVYYAVMNFFLTFLWHTLPKWFIEDQWQTHNYWLWIPIVSFSMIILVGLTVIFMGEPGDLPYTISRVHHFAFIPMDHVLPMVFASLFSILAGGSLGPEAPLVAICGALGGFVSRRVFRQQQVNVVRKHTLMGMSGALAAFFGVPLGGSMFALEVCSRFGIEYFEHLLESIFCGEICLVVFRSIMGLPIAPIWDFTSEKSARLFEIQPWLVLAGGVIGLMGALMAYVFATFHWTNMSIFARLQLLDNSQAVYRGLLGGFFVVLMGVLVPHTMFWGEAEIDVIGNLRPANELPNVWPTTGLTAFEMNSPWHAFVVGMAKIVAISFTVAGGLRGGYIFPLMAAGCSFGRAVHVFLPDSIPVQVTILCMAAGINVAITRTALASTLILAFLPGEPCAIPPILMASLCSLFATAYVPFIKTQITRSDIDHSLFHEKRVIGDDHEMLSDDED